MKNYTVLHLHSDFSNPTTSIDSVTKYHEYIDMACNLGMKAMAFTEHGNIFGWVNKKKHIESRGMKYIHGVEMYVTKTLKEKVRDNYHACLYARNYEGVLELNKLLSGAYERNESNHFYYAPRITFEELMATSDNIIITTACVGGILGKGDENLKYKYLKFLSKNKHRCFLEVQHHIDTKQIEYNKELKEYSKKYGIRLISATDTHALNETHAKGRAILKKAKEPSIFGGKKLSTKLLNDDDESGWDIIFKTYKELVANFRQQGVFSNEEIDEFINNTNVLADMVEEFTLDTSYKYPKLYDNPEAVLKQKIMAGIKERGVDKYPNYPEYIERIKRELKTYKHNKAEDFLLLDEDIKQEAKRQGRYYGYGRGSVSGSIIAYLLGLTEIDSIKHNTNFERFMSTERVSLADIDTDYAPSDREFIKDYIQHHDKIFMAEIITFNTIALKGSIRDVGRALGMELYIINEICNTIEEDEERWRNTYPELFEYVDIVNGTIISAGQHPCGVITSPIPLDETVGLLTMSTSKYPVSMINMKEVDSLNFVKLDVLGLDNIEIINKTCEMAGIERLTPDNVPLEKEVWDSIRDNTVGIFQWESDLASKYIAKLFSEETIAKIKEVNPEFSYIDLLDMGNGAIRPAGASYREELANGVFKDNGHKVLNDFLAPTLGYLVFQEQIIEFLNKFCGFTMGEADTVRRGFAKVILAF